MIIKRHFDQEMADLATLVKQQGQNALHMYDLCVERMFNIDEERMKQIQTLETEVNRAQMRIDDLSWKIMALYQPTASDLRTLIGAIKIASNLERMGDEIIVLGNRALDLAGHEFKSEPKHLLEMQAMTRSIMKDGLAVIANLDIDLAESIFSNDDVIDQTFHDLFEWVRGSLKKNPERADALLDYLSMGRSLERVGDYATNLSEIAIFMKKGQDVRHHGMAF